MLFHLVIGAMYLAKEEMTYEGKNVSVVRKLLKQYGSDPFVRKTLTALRRSNQIGILETIEPHPRIIFTYSRIWFFVSYPRFHVPAWN